MKSIPRTVTITLQYENGVKSYKIVRVINIANRRRAIADLQDQAGLIINKFLKDEKIREKAK